jgi:hypothetical protein
MLSLASVVLECPEAFGEEGPVDDDANTENRAALLFEIEQHMNRLWPVKKAINGCSSSDNRTVPPSFPMNVGSQIHTPAARLGIVTGGFKEAGFDADSGMEPSFEKMSETMRLPLRFYLQRCTSSKGCLTHEAPAYFRRFFPAGLHLVAMKQDPLSSVERIERMGDFAKKWLS